MTAVAAVVAIGRLRRQDGTRISMSITIDRPVSEVFAFVSDARNVLEWLPAAVERRKVTEGPIEPSDCLFGLPLCNGTDCVLGRVLTDANEKLWKYLSETTLADINLVFKHERFQVPRSI